MIKFDLNISRLDTSQRKPEMGLYKGEEQY